MIKAHNLICESFIDLFHENVCEILPELGETPTHYASHIFIRDDKLYAAMEADNSTVDEVDVEIVPQDD